MATHKGMQGDTYLDEKASELARQKWLEARDAAVASARALDAQQVSKQIVNRILEGYLWHEVIITGTEFGNFFALRFHADAEIHIAALAEKMLEAYNASTPRLLQAGEWHIPFDGQFDYEKLVSVAKSSLAGVNEDKKDGEENKEIIAKRVEEIKIEIAVARCARISYKPFGSESAYDYAADRKLFASLVSGGHFSPLEHVCRAMTDDEWQKNAIERDGKREQGWCGNVRGFIQMRKLCANENRDDPRIVKK